MIKRKRAVQEEEEQEDDDREFVFTLSDVDDVDGEGGETIIAAAADAVGDAVGRNDPPRGEKTKKNKRRKHVSEERDDDGHGGVNGTAAFAAMGESSPENRGKSSGKKNKAARSEMGSGRDNYEEGEGGNAEADDDDGAMDSDFEFQLEAGEEGELELVGFEGWGFESARRGLEGGGGNGSGSGKLVKRAVDIDEIIRRRKGEKDVDRDGGEVVDDEDHEETALELVNDGQDEFMADDGFGMGVASDEEESGDEGMLDEPGEDDSDREKENGDVSDDDSVATPVPHPDDLDDRASSAEEDQDDDPEEAARRDLFFAPEDEAPKPSKVNGTLTFQHMSLSRPIHRGLAAVGFSQPTPIQVKTIPVALLGKDVVGGAVTGSGKTAAFIVPILERLLYRPKKVPTSRVAILMPTRELAIQCHAVATKLASYTDIKFCLAVGGLSLKVQEAELRLRPDVIIATPGRFIDHMRNSASFTVDTLEILVLDEADRMLEDGFADELNEILTTIPKSRQTMLFSATMTSSVDKLIRVGLNRPVRLLVDAQRQTVGTLVQEFVRLRPGREDKRMGYLLYLCSKVYTDRAIVFFRQKKEAHRARVIFGLSGLKAAELHGSMSQEQRITSVEAFRDGKVSFLLATDLASRGLDIKGVDTVINYEAPQSHEIYLHRVGRTARAGRSGRACTLAAEADRKVVKAAVKSGRAQGAKIVSRVILTAEADVWAAKVAAMQEEIEEILVEEKEDKQLAQAEMQVKRGENIIVHEEEIQGRPKRTWFESEHEKRLAKKTGRAELNGPDGEKGAGSRKKMKKDGKLSNKDKKKLDDSREREEGKVWKKGRAERGGRGAALLAKGKGGGGKQKMMVGKGGKPMGKFSNKNRKR